LIGVVTTETPRSVGPGVAGLTVRDEAATARRYAARLRAEGVRAVVVLAHLGGRVDPASGRVVGPVADLARATAGLVDAIVSAHTHVGYVETIAGVLVTQAWAYGEAVAAIDLALDPEDGRVVTKSARLVRTWQDEVVADPAVAALVARYERAAAPVLAAPVARAAAAITRERSAAGEQALGNLIADAYRQATGADVALAHPGWNWADLSAGDVTWGDLFRVQPAGHDLVTLRLTGDQLRRLLEEQWRLERSSPLQVSGLAVEHDPARPFGHRLAAVRVAGAPLDPVRRYAVALNAYLAGGGDLFAVPLECADRTPGPKDLDALVAHVRRLPQPFAAGIEGRLRRARTRGMPAGLLPGNARIDWKRGIAR
jgi:5'-nucleotidase